MADFEAISKLNLYSVLKPPTGASVSKTILYAVLAPPPPIIVTCPVSAASLGIFYSSFFAILSGVAPFTLTLISGSFPPGLAMSSSGTLTGTPSQAGTFAYTIRVTDSLGTTVNVSCTIVVAISFKGLPC
jgi:hypothetical protein